MHLIGRLFRRAHPAFWAAVRQHPRHPVAGPLDHGP